LLPESSAAEKAANLSQFMYKQRRILSPITNVEYYSSNWSGFAYTEPAGTIVAITGTFSVPTPKAPSGDSSASASAWVGIDGDTCTDTILQIGIDFTVESGEVSYNAWYEWYPNSAYDFSGITISAGDAIALTITATSTSAGTAVIENVTTGHKLSKLITGSPALCEENAEWIVESYDVGASPVPFADFGTVTWTNAYATTNTGQELPISGATPINIEQNGVVWTSTSSSGTTGTIKYI